MRKGLLQLVSVLPYLALVSSSGRTRLRHFPRPERANQFLPAFPGNKQPFSLQHTSLVALMSGS
jgi:hypothetical protein